MIERKGKKLDLPEPMTDPAGSSASDFTPGAQISASRTSSRGRLHGSTVPLGRYVGTSFIECTAMSTRPSSSASSISLVNSPFPPMSARGCPRILSPVVLMMQISRAPSSARCGKAAWEGFVVDVCLSFWFVSRG
jgi:hypothetical protein